LSTAKRLKKREKFDDMPKAEKPLTEDANISISEYLLDNISDFRKFCPSFIKIQTKLGGLDWFELNGVQRLMEDVVSDIKAQGRLVRVVVLKSRRKGITTWVSGRYFHKTISSRNRHAMIITHEPEATDFVFKMHKRFYEHLPGFLRPTERYNNRKMLEFNNESGTGLDSAIRVGTAGKEDLGSSQLIHYLHMSELSKWPRHLATNLILSVLQCVPATMDSEIFIESTAKGVGGEFYDRYWGSRYLYSFKLKDGIPVMTESINEDASEDNEFSSVFIPWFVFNEYEREPRPNFKRTDEEVALARLMDAPPDLINRKLAWRRFALETQCGGNKNLFKQEYPATDFESFLSSDDNIFNVEQLRLLAEQSKPPAIRYDLQTSIGVWTASAKGVLKVWEEPKPGSQYVVGGDVAEGLHTGNFSCLDVVDAITKKQVAQYHAKMPPDMLGIIAAWLGTRYNNAVVAVERNNHGITTIDKMVDLGYRNIYAETIVAPPIRTRKRYGWLTTKSSKPRIIDNLNTLMRDNPTVLACKETMEEMMFFKQFEDGSMGAEVRRSDDRVMSMAIAQYVASKLRINRHAGGYKENAFGRLVKTQPDFSTTISPKGWT